MKEIWRDIPDLKGYQASNYGQIKSLKSNKILSQINNGNGYLYVTISINGKRKNYYVHRLIAQTFLKEFDDKKVINHKDYNKQNNNISNLENISQKENIRYSIKNKPKILHFKTNTGEHHISKRGNVYRVIINKKEYSCKTLKSAIQLRDSLIRRIYE